MASHGADPDEPGGALAAALLTQSVLPIVLIGPDFSPGRFRCHGPLVTTVSADEHSRAILPVVEAFGIVFDFDVEIDTVVADDDAGGTRPRRDDRPQTPPRRSADPCRVVC